MSDETIPQMRERIEALDKQVKDLSKARDEAAKENRTLKAREVFRDQGYDPNQAALFVGQNPEGDITPESVNEFAGQFNLKPVEAGTSSTEDSGNGETKTEEEEEPGTSTASADLDAMSGGGSGAGTGGQQTAGKSTLTRAEFNALSLENPAAARKAVSEGRVQLRGDNPLAVKR